MKHRCSLCGRFVKRITKAMGMPLSTGFPPDKPMLASTMPYAPFMCSNHREPSMAFNRVEYQLVGFPFY